MNIWEFRNGSNWKMLNRWCNIESISELNLGKTNRKWSYTMHDASHNECMKIMNALL